MEQPMIKTTARHCIVTLPATVLLCMTALPGMYAQAAAAGVAPAITVIRAGRLIDVEAGRVLSDQVLVIEGERIVAVGPAASARVPAGATEIDLSAATVLPGLLDGHVHLTSRHDNHGYRSLGVSTPRAALTGAANALRTLRAGFTTVRNLGAGGYADVALRDAINDGDVVGPRMLASGPSIGITGGHCDNNLLPAEYAVASRGVADGPWAVRQKVRENLKYGADVIKFCGTGGVLSKGTQIGAQQFTLEEMRSIVDEARMLGLRVAVHAHGTEGIKTAIRAGVHSVEHASLIDQEGIELALEHGTFLSMDIYVSDFILDSGEAMGILPESLDKERIVGTAQRESFRTALRAGVRMSFGSDAGVYPHGDNARQFARMVEWGMTPMQAIQAATIEAAELFGMREDVGALSVGRYADIIAVAEDPLSDVSALSQVGFVMKAGRVYRRDLLNGGS
jgi:imidazolonepropionase-like amidohydrolase